MSEHFERVKAYLFDLGHVPVREDEAEALVVITDVEQGINNLVIDCEDPILVLEQYIFDLRPDASADALVDLLKANRSLVHGAFALDDSGTKVLFRDTLQLENLDLNELEASINALSLAMAENASLIVKMARG